MTIPVSQPGEQPENPMSNEEASQAAMPSQPAAFQSTILPPQAEAEDSAHSQSFYFEDEEPDLGSPFVAPFQISDAMPTVLTQAQPSGQGASVPPAPATPSASKARRFRLSLPIIAIIVCVVVILGLLAMNALAQTAPVQTSSAGPSPMAQHTLAPGKQQKPTMTAPHSTPIPTTIPGQTPPNGVPQQLPHGWTQAGLSAGDAIQALRTAATFTDRQMSLDYRSVGTRTMHGGTFTAATFLLTPAARQRYMTNDVREINNTLFDMVVNTKLIRLVIAPQPQLVTFAVRGQQQFAWVDVAFQLWQSQIDSTNPHNRLEGIELDPKTKQPRVHHLMVLLLHVSQQEEGANPAMGGTGWLVSNYGLDLPNGTPLEIVQPA
jgi:hypothetical protein